jgi:hypothetical protein
MKDYKEIPLTKGKVAIVDAADFEWLSQWKWHYSAASDGRHGYARRAIYLGGGSGAPKLRRIKMHREIMDAPVGIMVDHVNGDTLDNRRRNLRLAHDWQNGANRSANSNKPHPYKGVYYVKPKSSDGPWKCWVAILVESTTGKKRRHSLGMYHTPQEAAQAYNQAAKEYFGEFALLNDVPEPEQPFNFGSPNSKTGYRGVRQTKSGLWQIQIAYEGTMHHIGTCSDLQDALLVYNASAIEYKGPDAYLNPID